MTKFTHLNEQGAASMVDVSAKDETSRTAVAESVVQFSADVYKQICDEGVEKGDLYAVARVAGIQGAKRCADLIPLCHPLALSKVSIDFELDESSHQIRIQCLCKLKGTTGVEMEALTGASVAALTIYDMCKALDKGISILNTELISKTGGKSGDWQRT